MARRSTASLGSSVGAPCTWQRKPSSAYLSARTMPDLASRNDATPSCVLLPMDETMPIPVTTTRFMCASCEILVFWFEHDLIRKPGTTFRDHAPACRSSLVRLRLHVAEQTDLEVEG